MTRQRGASGNEGIQANTVTADVIAVGRGARATKTVLADGDRKQLLEALGKIQTEVDKLNLDAAQRDEIKQHAAQVERTLTVKQPDPVAAQGALQKFVGKLKTVGVIVNDAAGLVAPLHTIAGLLHLSLSAIGLVA